MAATSFMRTWQDFDLIQLVILPLFLFSATFYPLDAYPEALQWVVRITPLYQGVDLIRSLAVRAISPVLLVHVAYLTAMGLIGLAITNRRLGKLLLKRGNDRPGGAGGADRRPGGVPSLPAAGRVARGVAREKVARFRDETYWARPCPHGGLTRILLLGLAPRRTAATGPGGCSPATRRVTSSLRCMRSGSPTGRSAGAPTTA